MPDINWLSFIIGAGFAIFILPLLSQILGRIKGKATQAKVA